MDFLSAGMKKSGHCREVATSGGSMMTKILARSCPDFIERVLANASHVDIIRFYDLFSCYCQIFIRS